MKKLLCIVAFVPLLCGAVGCGGSDEDPRIAVTPRFVPVTLAVQWAELSADATRVVAAPGAVRSVVVRVIDLAKSPPTETDLVTVATINRDITNRAAYRQSFTTPTVVARPNRDTFAEVRFYAEPDGQGVLLASAFKRTLLPANGDLGDFDFATAVPQN